MTVANSSILGISAAAFSINSAHMKDSDETEKFFNLRTKHTNNPLIGFLNINSLRNKTTDFRFVMERCLLDISVIEETKLSSVFLTESFLTSNYQKPIRQDRNEFGGA